MTRTPGAVPGTPEPLARQLSGLGVWLLVINGIIGAGIFGMPSEAARLDGGFSPWVFVICAALMTTSAGLMGADGTAETSAEGAPSVPL